MPSSVVQSLENMVRDGALSPDPQQLELAARLDRLIEALAERRGFFRRPVPVRGLYLWGDAGRGKTLLMDLFFRTAREPRKRRVHFHAFMTEMHERLRNFRDVRGKQPIEALAEAVAKEARLLCLDELQVKDIADATILNRLFEGLIANGTVVVATSNAPPERLYYKGLNRALFLPFIDLVTARMDVVKLEIATDFRLRKLTAAPVWTTPPDRAALDAAFLNLTGTATGEPQTLRVQGRDLRVPHAHDGVARFTFAELCESPLGPADFVAIARTYHTLLVDNIPSLDSAAQDAVRRFILLIDELYEYRVKLIASADSKPDMLLTQGKQSWDFRRTSSRLTEMGSQHWLGLPHGQEVDLNASSQPE